MNPDGKKTPWKPRSKKIWFTEFGFPSIDKATNQPNVFYDENSSEGGVPRYSNGNIDLSLQRRAIKSFIEYWSKEEYIEEMFLWTWDARPYPAWPSNSKKWGDTGAWSRGHWVNNKFGKCQEIGDVILEIMDRASIDISNIISV